MQRTIRLSVTPSPAQALALTLRVRPGDLVVAGEPVALAWPGARVGDARCADLVDTAFDQIRTYGRDHFVVIVRLLETIAKVGGATDAPERLEPLRRQA